MRRSSRAKEWKIFWRRWRVLKRDKTALREKRLEVARDVSVPWAIRCHLIDEMVRPPLIVGEFHGHFFTEPMV